MGSQTYIQQPKSRDMRRIFIILAALLLSVSCMKEDAIEFEGVDNFGLTSLSLSSIRAEGDVTFSNSSYRKVVIEDVELTAYSEGRKFATATLSESLTIKRRGTFSSRASLDIKLSSPLAALSLLSSNKNLDNIYVDGDIWVKVGPVKRQFSVGKIYIGDFLGSKAFEDEKK